MMGRQYEVLSAVQRHRSPLPVVYAFFALHCDQYMQLCMCFCRVIYQTYVSFHHAWPAGLTKAVLVSVGVPV